MKRIALLFLSSFAAACAHTTVPAPAPITTPAAPVAAAPVAAPCNPGHTILSATLWQQASAEYEATTRGIFAAARRSLDAALADPSWIGATEETADGASQPPAIVVDADETVVDNTPFQTRVIRAGHTFDKKMWETWVSEAAARAVPGAAEFLSYAASRGVAVFYVTNRDHPQETAGTRENLVRLGFPVNEDYSNVLLRGGRPEWKSDKSTRRAHAAATHRVLLLFGDDLNDFANAREATAAERDAIVERHAAWWGTRWFMLPNAMYGSWERAAIGSGHEGCDEVQRKVDALVDR